MRLPTVRRIQRPALRAPDRRAPLGARRLEPHAPAPGPVGPKPAT